MSNEKTPLMQKGPTEHKNLVENKRTAPSSYLASITNFFYPERLQKTIKQGTLKDVIDLLDNKKATLNTEYGGTTPLKTSLDYGKPQITLALLERGANPNAQFDFSSVGSDKKTIMQSEVDNDAASNVRLLGIYGACPDQVIFNKNSKLEATLREAYGDYINKNQLEKAVAQNIDIGAKTEALTKLIALWEKYATVEGQADYKEHYRNKAVNCRNTQAELNLTSQPGH
jgi:hypothetical protein